ncbi:MAG: hypothetical protein AAFQ78_01900, partial [Bacteroidota bacterium]
NVREKTRQRLKCFLKHYKEKWIQIAGHMGNDVNIYKESRCIRAIVRQYIKCPYYKEMTSKHMGENSFNQFRRVEDVVKDLEKKLAGESEEAPENELKHTQASPYKGKQKSIFNVFLENLPPMQNNWTSNGLREAPTGALVLPSGSGSGLCPHQGSITAQHNYGDDENLNAPPTKECFLKRMHGLQSSVLDA